MASSEYFDVIIIGGGPAGAAASIILASHGIYTAIIESSDYTSPRVGETLPPEIHSPLIQLGAWRSFVTDGHIESFALRSAWGSSRVTSRSHIYNPYGSGWHIDRSRFDRMLIKVASNAGATVLIGARATNLLHDRKLDWQVTSLQPRLSRNLHARFLIDATGQTAAIPTGLPRSYRVVDRLIAVVRFFAHVAKPYILIEAQESGWWYSAPVPHNRLIVAHMTDSDLFAASGCSPSQYWHRQLVQAPHTYERTGQQTVLAKPKIVTTASLFRNPISGVDWAAAGDACIALDPLSGQGVYNALKGGILVAQAIIARINGKNEPFAKYTKWINSQFTRYMIMRRLYYSKEQRWPHSPFWRRRHLLPSQTPNLL